MRSGVKGEREHEVDIDSGQGAWRWGFRIDTRGGWHTLPGSVWELCFIYSINLLSIQKYIVPDM